MPYRRRYRNRKNPRRRRNYRKRRNQHALSKVVNLSTGIPDSIMTKLKYTGTYTLSDATGGVGAAQIFRGNSIYDPDYTGVGGQPLGHDEWANFYTYYKVHGSSIKVTFLPTVSTVANSNLVCSVCPTLGIMSTGSFTSVDLMEQPYANWTISGPANGGVIRTLKKYMSTKKIFGQKQIDDDDFEGVFSGNPQNPWYWSVFAFPVDGSSTFTLDMVVQVTYYVELKNRINLPQS